MATKEPPAQSAEPLDEVESLPYGAPVMPRYPTLIRGQIPQPVTEFDDDEEPISDHLHPPPRFPSLPNVELSKATATAEAMSSIPEDAEESVGRKLEQEIAESIERGSVEPGAGVRRAAEARSRQWNSMDQRRLDSLLHRATTENGLLEGSTTVPMSPTQPPPAQPPVTTSTPTASRGSVPVSPPVTTSVPSHTPATASAPAQPKAASGGILSALATVPMTTFKQPGAEPQVEHFGGGTIGDVDDINEKHGAMVRSKSQSAKVSITGDFGLKGGHEGIVHDSVFFDSKTLVTAGADGKVCIWDLEEKFVTAQFEPYNGHSVQMIYPIQDSDGAATRSLITLSADRLMRVWNLVDEQAVLLRSMQIPPSARDLVMSVPVLTPQMKAHAAAAAAAAAVTTTDLTDDAPSSMDTSMFAVAGNKTPAYYGGIKKAMEKKEDSPVAVKEEKKDSPVAVKEEKKETEEPTTAASTEVPQVVTKRFSFNVFKREKKVVAS